MLSWILRIIWEGKQHWIAELNCASVLPDIIAVSRVVPRRSPLHYAAANGNSQCTISLVRAGAEVNELDLTGCSPLHYTAASHTFCGWESTYVLILYSFYSEVTKTTSCGQFSVDNDWLNLSSFVSVLSFFPQWEHKLSAWLQSGKATWGVSVSHISLSYTQSR